MCYASLDPKLLQQDVEDRLRGVNWQLNPAEKAERAEAAGMLARFFMRLRLFWRVTGEVRG
jgi:hypothetical protein